MLSDGATVSFVSANAVRFVCDTVQSDLKSPRSLWRSANQLLGRGRPPASYAISMDEFSRFFMPGVPCPREAGLWWGENFWLHLTAASAQCLRLSERFFVIIGLSPVCK